MIVNKPLKVIIPWDSRGMGGDDDLLPVMFTAMEIEDESCIFDYIDNMVTDIQYEDEGNDEYDESGEKYEKETVRLINLVHENWHDVALYVKPLILDNVIKAEMICVMVESRGVDTILTFEDNSC